MDTVYDLSFKNVCYNAKSFVSFKKKEPKKILKNICGEFRGNELTGIVGLSGSGKSSLLDCLSGFRQNNITGIIMLNGITVPINSIKQISTYVMQEQTLHTLLTINEIMNFSINLRDKQNLSHVDKEQKIGNIFEKLNITSRCDTYIRDLSGGERKRVQIAVELVTDPTILFLDECTTGLDSVSSFQCIRMLQKLSREGKTIICTVHQPSATMLKLFDHIYALNDGSCIYQGSSENLITFFRDLDLPCPETYNPSDFLLELANNDYGEHNARLIEKIDNGNNSSYRHIESLNNNDETKCLNRSKVEITSQPTKYSTSYLRQVYYLMQRTFLMATRDTSLFLMRVLIHVFVGIIFGYIYKDVGNKGSTMLDNYRFLVITVVFLLYTSYHSLFIAFPLEFPIVKREHFNGWYSTRAYYTAFMVFELPITLLCTLSYVSITYWMTDQPREVDRFLIFACFGVITSLASQSLGVTVTALMDIKTSTIIGMFFLTPFFLFSAIMITTKDAPPFFHIFFEANFLDCGLKGILNSVLGLNRTKLECDDIYCHFGNPKKVLRDFGAEIDMTKAFSIIMLYIAVCQLASFVMFRYRLKNRLS